MCSAGPLQLWVCGWLIKRKMDEFIQEFSWAIHCGKRIGRVRGVLICLWSAFVEEESVWRAADFFHIVSAPHIFTDATWNNMLSLDRNLYLVIMSMHLHLICT